MFREMLEFLAGDGWPVAPDTFDGLPCIRTRFVGTDDAWDCRARPYDPFGQLAFESILPITVEPERRDAVMQLIVRANWRLLTGAFQLDVDTGELVFRTMLFLSDGVGAVRGALPRAGLQQRAHRRPLPGRVQGRGRRRGRGGRVRAARALSLLLTKPVTCDA